MEHDLVSAVLRVTLGVVFVAHGWNHGFGPGGLAGTARWFDSIGLRPAKVHAAISAYLEIAAGLALVVGLLVPLAAAAAIGVMVTAFMTVHRTNGFFILKEGYEYVLVLVAALFATAALGAGAWSLDALLDLDRAGWEYGAAALAAGVVGSLAMLAVCWRPQRSA